MTEIGIVDENILVQNMNEWLRIIEAVENELAGMEVEVSSRLCDAWSSFHDYNLVPAVRDGRELLRSYEWTYEQLPGSVSISNEEAMLEFMNLQDLFADRTLGRNLPFLVCWCGNRGLGVIPRTDNYTELRSDLWGVEQPINSAEVWNSLCQHNHPSLFSSNGLHSIMYGPLSIVNHACTSRWTWRRETVLLENVNEIVSNWQGPSEVDGIRLCRRYHTAAVVENEELMVYYGSINFDCMCNARRHLPNSVPCLI